jgi:hypothetical protein
MQVQVTAKSMQREALKMLSGYFGGRLSDFYREACKASSGWRLL